MYTWEPALTTLEILVTSFDKFSLVPALSNVHCYVVLLVKNTSFGGDFLFGFGVFFNDHVVWTRGVSTMCAGLSQFSMIVSCCGFYLSVNAQDNLAFFPFKGSKLNYKVHNDLCCKEMLCEINC